MAFNLVILEGLLKDQYMYAGVGVALLFEKTGLDHRKSLQIIATNPSKNEALESAVELK